MILVGQYDSPYVRRVAVTLHHLGLAFERRDLSVFGDAEAMREINPLGRVPSLVLDDGEILVDSAAILDHLDEVVGPSRALLPANGGDRRHALQIVGLATGMIDKAGAIVYEYMLRPADARHQPWIDRNKIQIDSALLAMEALVPDKGWFGGDRLLQPDITVASALAYFRLRRPFLGDLPPHPKLTRLSVDAEALAEFTKSLPTIQEIGGPDAQSGLDRLRGLA